MTYDRQDWVDGSFGATPLSAARLEHMEDGIEDANSGNYVGTVFRVGPVDRGTGLATGGPSSSYFVADRENTTNDATTVYRTQGAVTAEVGVNGDNDVDRDSDLHIKVAHGVAGFETFVDAIIALNPSGDVWFPGRVGVGTVPAEKMHIAASQSSGRLLYKVENTNLAAGSQSAGVQLQGGETAWTASTDVGQNGGDNFAIQSGTIGYTPVIMCTATGDVGIGTDSPAGKLHVGGVVFMANTTAASVTTPSGGGKMFVDNGALKYKGSAGTVTTIAPA